MYRLLPCDATQNAVMRLHVVCPSATLRYMICTQVGILRKKLHGRIARVPALTDPDMRSLVQRLRMSHVRVEYGCQFFTAHQHGVMFFKFSKKNVKT